MAQERQHKKSQKHFETIFAAGLSLYQAGDHQTAAEKLLQAVRAAPSVWTKHRFFAFSTFVESISITDSSMTQSHVELITKDFIENENEPVHFQVRALLSVAYWYTQSGSHFNNNTAAAFFRQGLEIIASSPKEDENRQVLYHPHPYNSTLKCILGILAENCQSNLSLITAAPISQAPSDAKHARLRERARAGGMVCDCCGKTLEELQMTSFKRFSRCEMVFYCSPACQREHWAKKGHKRACREKGQIEIGDDMHIAKTEPDGTVFCVYVEVISSAGGDCWQVKQRRWHDDGRWQDEVITVNGADLIRLRPPSTLS